MAGYYSAADLFVFPGIGESLGMVYLEAEACGLPVAALDLPGVRQVVKNGETGLLAPMDENGAMLAEAVRKLLRDPENRRRLGAAAVAFIDRERNLHRNYALLIQKLERLAAGD
jgi:glycosyltransferase involved in cell wall biosynthesis